MPHLREDLRADLRAITGGGAGPWLLLKNLAFDSGFRLLLFYRLSALFFAYRALRPLGLVCWQLGILLSSCHLSPRAVIHGGVLFPHACGIVIGDGVEISAGCVVYQNVTLGRIRRNKPGCPLLERDVTLYAGATIVGDVCIGERAVVGANGFVSRNMEPGSQLGPNEVLR